MNYDECISILRQFEKAHALTLLDTSVTGVRVSMEGEPALEISVTTGTEVARFAQEFNVPQSFQYENQNGKQYINVRVVESDIYEALEAQGVLDSETDDALVALPTRSGDPARGVGLPGIGTAGWTIFLDGVLVCLSNWHVFCPAGNNTPIGHPVEINFQNVAAVHFFYPVPQALPLNLWDLALAAYTDPTAATAQMRSCEDGVISPYPRRLTGDIRLGDGAIYRKVGMTRPICRRGRLMAVGNVSVKYGDNNIIWFHDQLIFEKMSDKGDSGSVIVREADNTVTGLNFAGTPIDTTGPQETIANPIFRLGWTFGGTRFINDVEIPAFESADQSMNSHTRMPLSSFAPFDDIPSASTPDLPAIFQIGQIFLSPFNLTGLPTNATRLQLLQLSGVWGLFRFFNLLGTVPPREEDIGNGWVYIPNAFGSWRPVS